MALQLKTISGIKNVKIGDLIMVNLSGYENKEYEVKRVNGCGTLWIEYIFSDSYPKTNQTIYPENITHLNGESILNLK